MIGLIGYSKVKDRFAKNKAKLEEKKVRMDIISWQVTVANISGRLWFWPADDGVEGGGGKTKGIQEESEEEAKTRTRTWRDGITIVLSINLCKVCNCILQVGDPDMMAMMGFSGFGTSSKKTWWTKTYWPLKQWCPTVMSLFCQPTYLTSSIVSCISWKKWRADLFLPIAV